MSNNVFMGKSIVLGVTGSIAAYKAADLASKLVSSGADVQVVMSLSAARFITPVTMRALTGRDCLVDQFDESTEGQIAHVTVVERAHLLLIAPATANIIGKMAHGIADDMLSTLTVAAKCPVLISPAMNSNMWTNPIVIANVDRLKTLGYHFVDPVEGRLACGMVGIGKLAPVETIIQSAAELLGTEPKRDWQGIRVLVTSGPTREPIDPVRYLSNYSTGRMGYAIAEAAQSRGAEVILVTGPTEASPPDVGKLVRVETAAEMLEAVKANYDEAHIVISAAAVSDFAPKKAAQKIKKDGSLASEAIRLFETTDILAELGKNKGSHVLAGFALETEDLVARAKRKLRAKNLDVIVANSAGDDNHPFGSGPSKVRIITSAGDDIAWPMMSKQEIAEQLLSFLKDRYFNSVQ